MMKNKIIDIISNAEGVDDDTIKEIKEYLDKFDNKVERILEGKDKAMERFTNKLKEKEEE
jgi:tetrahydromethanopterin S-methyltransferase subunit G